MRRSTEPVHGRSRRRLLSVSVALFAAALGACAAFTVREPLSASIADIQILESTLFEQRYLIKVRLLNPNDAAIDFDGVTFDVELNGQPFAKGVSDERSTVPRFGETVVTVNAVSRLDSMLRQIQALMEGDRAKLEYRITGRLNVVGLGGVPFENRGELGLPNAFRSPSR